eukprot:12263007-Alexandrium_andersonii.AAC.1
MAEEDESEAEQSELEGGENPNMKEHDGNSKQKNEAKVGLEDFCFDVRRRLVGEHHWGMLGGGDQEEVEKA